MAPHKGTAAPLQHQSACPCPCQGPNPNPAHLTSRMYSDRSSSSPLSSPLPPPWLPPPLAPSSFNSLHHHRTGQGSALSNEQGVMEGAEHAAGQAFTTLQ